MLRLHAVDSHIEAAFMRVPMFSIILTCTACNHAHCHTEAQLYWTAGQVGQSKYHSALVIDHFLTLSGGGELVKVDAYKDSQSCVSQFGDHSKQSSCHVGFKKHTGDDRRQYGRAKSKLSYREPQRQTAQSHSAERQDQLAYPRHFLPSKLAAAVYQKIHSTCPLLHPYCARLGVKGSMFIHSGHEQSSAHQHQVHLVTLQLSQPFRHVHHGLCICQ